MQQLYSAFTLFLSLLVEAMPFLLLGVLLSSALFFFVDESVLINRIPRQPILGAFVGSCIGFLFPVCECGNVPVARRLISKGIPPSVAVGFLLAAPTINPVVIWSTWVAFRDRPEIVFWRVFLSLAISTIIASIFSVQTDARPIVQPMLSKRLNVLMSYNANRFKKSDLLDGSKSLLPTIKLLEKQPKKWQLFVDNAIQELRELGAMLVIGSAIASVIQVFVSRNFIINLAEDNISAIVAMIILAGIVSICSTVDSFFALSFASVFSSSALLAFLVFGPIMDIKAFGLMMSIFRPRIIIYIFLLAALMTFIFTVFHSYLF